MDGSPYPPIPDRGVDTLGEGGESKKKKKKKREERPSRWPTLSRQRNIQQVYRTGRVLGQEGRRENERNGERKWKKEREN